MCADGNRVSANKVTNGFMRVNSNKLTDGIEAGFYRNGVKVADNVKRTRLRRKLNPLFWEVNSLF